MLDTYYHYDDEPGNSVWPETMEEAVEECVGNMSSREVVPEFVTIYEFRPMPFPMVDRMTRDILHMVIENYSETHAYDGDWPEPSSRMKEAAEVLARAIREDFPVGVYVIHREHTVRVADYVNLQDFEPTTGGYES